MRLSNANLRVRTASQMRLAETAGANGRRGLGGRENDAFRLV